MTQPAKEYAESFSGVRFETFDSKVRRANWTVVQGLRAKYADAQVYKTTWPSLAVIARDHDSVISYGYEEHTCTCGYDFSTAKEGETFLDHVLEALA